MAQESFATLKDKELRKFLNDVSNNLRDIRSGSNRYVRQVSPIAFANVMKHFQQEMGPEGPWSPWSSSYIKQIMSRKRKPANILQDNGRLRNSVIPAIGIKGRKNEIPILVNKAKTTKNFPYAAHHDEGKSDGKKPREFMWLDDTALGNLAIETLDFLDKEK